jgi:hypothetical protein
MVDFQLFDTKLNVCVYKNIDEKNFKSSTLKGPFLLTKLDYFELGLH